MTNTPSDSNHATSDTARRSRRRRWAVAIAAAVATATAIVVALVATRDDGRQWQIADIGEQGQIGTSMVTGGARLERRADGLTVEVVVPTPAPGSYEYPTAGDIPPTAEPHPPISAGAREAPEVFTLWMFVFNAPAQCTDGQCDNDDFAPGVAARGGVFQVDGRIGDDDELRLAGGVRLGQTAITGAPLDDPEGAEVHVAIAPHGRVRSGEDVWRQLNGPVGNPTLWWGASFPTP